jgi:hypothetical protein
VNRHGYHIADVRTVRELAGLGVDVADLTETGLQRHRTGQLQPRLAWMSSPRLTPTGIHRPTSMSW